MYEKKNFIVASVSLGIAIVGVLLAYRAIAVSQELAQLSGQLDRAEFDVGIGSTELKPDQVNYVFVGAKELSRAGSLSIGALPFEFISKGKKTLDSLAISFQYSQVFRRDVLEAVKMSQEGPFSTTRIQRDSIASGGRYYVNYAITSLHPGTKVKVDEPVFLINTTLEQNVPVTTRDGIDMVLPVRLKYFANFGLVTSARDMPVQSYSISLAFEKVNSLAELVNGRFSEHVEARQGQVRKQLGSISYLLALLTSNSKESVSLVFIDQQSVAKNGGQSTILPVGSPEIVCKDYELLSWSKLLDAD